MALYETEACQSAVLAAALTGSNLPWSEAINNYDVCELKKLVDIYVFVFQFSYEKATLTNNVKVFSGDTPYYRAHG